MCIKCIDRLNMIMSNVKNCNDGSSIHEVATIRHLAINYIELAKRGINPDMVCEGTAKLRQRTNEFLVKRFYPDKRRSH